MTSPLTVADLRFINLVAARKFAAAEPGAVDEEAVSAALAKRNDAASGDAYARTAQLVARLVQQQAFSTAPLQTALLVMHCALATDGLQLLAPQGVVAGMIGDIVAGGDPLRLSHWLEDRAVPAAGGG